MTYNITKKNLDIFRFIKYISHKVNRVNFNLVVVASLISSPSDNIQFEGQASQRLIFLMGLIISYLSERIDWFPGGKQEEEVVGILGVKHLQHVSTVVSLCCTVQPDK